MRMDVVTRMQQPISTPELLIAALSEQLISERAVITEVGAIVCRVVANSECACVSRPASLIKRMKTALISL